MAVKSSIKFADKIAIGIPDELPPKYIYDNNVSHAVKRKDILTKEEKKLALRNSLRYFPKNIIVF